MADRYPKSEILITVMLAIGVFTVRGISISSVAVTFRDEIPVSSTKSMSSTINVPLVPEFPKLVARPAKNPVGGGRAPGNNQVNSQQQQQQQPQQSFQNSQQTHTFPVQTFGLPVPLPALPVIPDSEQQILETGHFTEEDNTENQEDYINDNNYQESSRGEETDRTSSVPTINESAPNKPVVQPEKIQPADFPMPLHVMHILNALGTGGSLAQATKPEKDGAGEGSTTANAIGYATGDNATVTASVSNKMELNTQTVILTESASASASSKSNGTAFSQATLAGNGYSSQFGGSGWKAGNKNPLRFK